MRIFKSPSQREYFSRDQGELPPFLRELFTTVPGEVVQPDTAAEIIDVVKVAAKNGTPVVARGAASTAFGQVIPVKGGLTLDLNFYKAVRKLDRNRASVTVESGIRWADLDSWLEPRGYAVGSYPSSWYSTVGGWIATGGYGIGSLKFGAIKQQVLELYVCTGDGKDLRLRPGDARFDAFFETEGQMGVVLEVTLKIRPRPEAQTPVLLSLPELPQAWDALRKGLAQNFDLFHASVYNRARMAHFDRNLEEKMTRKGAAVPPALRFSEGCGVLLVAESGAAAVKDWAKAQGFKLEPDFKASFVWDERFYPLKGKKADQMFLGNEVLIGHDKAGGYCGDLEALGAAEGLHLAVEGEVAGKDRSLVLASFLAPAADMKRYAQGLSAVFRMDRLGTVQHGGTLYHIGIYNTPFLSRKFSPERLAALYKAKAELDPNGILNPGKFFSIATTKTAWMPDWLHGFGARTLVALLGTPGAGPLLAGMFAPWLGKMPAPGEDRVLRMERECVDCGFCLPVCPAYLATRDERTTARGKLHIFARAQNGYQMTQDDVELLHSCMHCGGCTAVCQSALDLVPAWDEMEMRIARDHGKPTRAIVDFVKSVEETDDYKRLLRRGTITELKTANAPRAQGAGEGAAVKVDSGGRGRGRGR